MLSRSSSIPTSILINRACNILSYCCGIFLLCNSATHLGFFFWFRGYNWQCTVSVVWKPFMFECHYTMHSFSNSNLLELSYLTTENHLPLEISGRGHFFHIRHFNRCHQDFLQCFLLRKYHFPIFKSFFFCKVYSTIVFLLLILGFFFLQLGENHWFGRGVRGNWFFTQCYTQWVTYIH